MLKLTYNQFNKINNFSSDEELTFKIELKDSLKHRKDIFVKLLEKKGYNPIVNRDHILINNDLWQTELFTEWYNRFLKTYELVSIPC